MADRTDADLVNLTRKGDRESYSTLVARYQGHVYGLAYSLVSNWADAQDIAQETFIRAYVNLDQLRDPARFAPWLRRVTFGVAMNWLKAYRPGFFEQLEGRVDLDSLEIPDFAPGPAEVVEKRELADAVQRAIASLPPKYRVPLTMFHLDGLSYRKVAEFLDIPLGTVRSLIHRAREKLRPALAAHTAEEVSPMVQEVFNEHKLPPEFSQEIGKRISHWERFDGTVEQKVHMVEQDPEWTRLVALEMELEPLSPECREIRRQIACLERCHEHYTDNLKDILGMIGSMTPRGIIDCGQACAARNDEVSAYAQALRTWRDADRLPQNADGRTSEVFQLLGERTEPRLRLVTHLTNKLQDNAYNVYSDDEEDFDLIESRIQHLEICNYNWKENLRIVLREIAAGRRLFRWHVPDGYNAHGDCPDRVGELKDMMASAAAWAEGKAQKAGTWAQVLGKPTPEKRWLVASLCKNVSAHHSDFDQEGLLARPSL